MEFDALRSGQQFDCDDLRGVFQHRVQASRGERRHAHMVLLVRGRRDAVHTCRMRQRLVLRGQGSRCDLHHHETAVEPALLDQEGGQTAQVLVHEQSDAAFG